MRNQNDKKDSNQRYGVIHELGDYSQFKQLNDEDNERVKQQLLNEQKSNKNGND